MFLLVIFDFLLCAFYQLSLKAEPFCLQGDMQVKPQTEIYLQIQSFQVLSHLGWYPGPLKSS